MVRIVVGGRELDLTMDEVVRKMRNVQPETIREHLIEIGNTVYPPKQALAQVTGWGRDTFTTMEALRVFNRLGFVSRRAGRRPDGQPAWVPSNPDNLKEEESPAIDRRDGGHMAIEGQPQCFEPGFAVALRLRPGTAPLRSYVGEIRTTDEHGMRVTLADWFIGAFVSHDMYVPWANIEMAYVATPDDKLADGELGRWQEELSQDESAPRREHGLQTD